MRFDELRQGILTIERSVGQVTLPHILEDDVGKVWGVHVSAYQGPVQEQSHKSFSSGFTGEDEREGKRINQRNNPNLIVYYSLLNQEEEKGKLEQNKN